MLANVSSEVGHGASFLNGGGKAAAYKAVGHGLSRTAISQLRYGTTKGAFMSGFISSGFSVGAGGGSIKGAFQMAIVGGTVSKIGGGKFANGAMTSAFQFLLNDMAYGMSDPLTGDGSGILDPLYGAVEDGWNSLQSFLGLNPNGAPSKIMNGVGRDIPRMWKNLPSYAKAPLVVASGIVALPVTSTIYTYMYMNPSSISYSLDAIGGALPGIAPYSEIGYGVATGAGLAGIVMGASK